MDRITFDFNNMLAHSVGAQHGICPAELDQAGEQLAKAHAQIEKYRTQHSYGFLYLPYETAEIKAVRTLADKIARRFENFVVLGIGGSALGNIALHNALHHPFYNMLSRAARKNRPRIFVQDNIDPDHLSGLLDTLDLSRTCFNVITKSGDTVETMASFFLMRDRLRRVLGPKRVKDHLVATTSPKQGTLLEIAQKEGYRTLKIPENVGGRFSVLSAVGLLSAAVSGIAVEQLCRGAQAMDKACRSADVKKNPALLAAALQYLAYQKGKRISVLMPYAHALKEIADWYAQLWAESLGKELDRNGAKVFVGPTPVKALGVTDQHSQLQLYREGPFDKVITFVTVEKFRHRLKIPPAFPNHDIRYLSGHTFGGLLQAEQEATAMSLLKACRMNATIRLSKISPRTVGMLLYFFQLETAYAGELLNINTFDQPGVEAGKQYAYGILGRKGFDAQRQEFLSAPKPDPRYVVQVA